MRAKVVFDLCSGAVVSLLSLNKIFIGTENQERERGGGQETRFLTRVMKVDRTWLAGWSDRIV